MKQIIFILSILFCSSLFAQVPQNKSAFIGCWEFKDFADKKSLKRIYVEKTRDYSIWFINDSLYQTYYRYGTWAYNHDFRRIYLFKKKFTATDIEKANHYQKAPEIVTRIELNEIILRGNSLYFLVYNDVEPYVMYARCERVKCE